MADAKTYQELKSYFETGDQPTQQQFEDTLNSVLKIINGTFTETDISDDGEITITYPSSSINGVATTTAIAKPLFAVIYGSSIASDVSGVYMCKFVDTASCKIALGTPSLPAGTYHFLMFYQS